MKKLSVVTAILMMAVSLSLYSSNEVRMIPLDSSVYGDIEALYLVAGYGTPSNKAPWSVAEADLILSRIDVNSLSFEMKAFYDRIEAEVNSPLRYDYDELVDFGFNADVYGELYAHSNGDEFSNEADWTFGFPERKPMILLRMDMAFSDFLYIYSDLQYGRNRFTDEDSFDQYDIDEDEGIITSSGGGKYSTLSSIFNQAFLTNWMSATWDLDFQTPKRALIATGSSNWNLSLSRDKIRWGNGHSGNFVISDHDDYQEYLRFVTFSDKFSYDWTNMFFETNYNSGEGSSADEQFKMFMAHRLEFRPIDSVTFALSENVMYQNDVFSLRHFNPANIYHNLNSRTMFNAIAHAELDVMVSPGINLYGQFALDQARAPNEGDSQADASAYLFGIEYAKEISSGILFSSLEFASTSPAMYRRELVDFITIRRYHGNGTSFVTHFDYLGYEYGGDAKVIQLDVTYRLPEDRNIAFQLFYMRHGEVDFFTDNSIVNDITESSPSGEVVEETLSATLSGEYTIENLISFIDSSLWANVSFVQKWDYTKATESVSNYHTDVQLTVGMGLSF
ncbi:MAG: capsule assembly Wzi family protein [Spirochaetaceae bacterium JB067]